MAKTAKTASAAKKSKAKRSKKPDKGQVVKDAAERTKRGTLGLKKTDRKPSAKAKSRAEAGRKMPSAGQLQSVINDVQGFMDKAKSFNGKGRARISEGVADFSLNKVAFSMARKLIKVGTEDPNKLMVLLEDFDHYRKVLKIDDLAGPGLFAGAIGTSGTDIEDGDKDDKSKEETKVPSPALAGDEASAFH